MEDLSQFKDLFISEAEDLLQKLNDGLLKLEKTPEDKDLLDELMRNSHTMKGSSKTMQYNALGRLTHLLEDIFDGARNDKLSISQETVEEIFKALDCIKECINSIKESDKETDLGEISEKIAKASGVEAESEEGAKAPEKPNIEEPAKEAPGQEPKSEVKTEPKVETIKTKRKSAEKEVDQVSYIKVPVKRLDELMATTEELLINKMQLQLLVDAAEKKAEKTTSGECTEITGLVAATEQLERLVGTLQYSVMESRLVPLEQIFARFPRMMRDLASQEKKEIEIVVKGGDLELDRTIIDKLGEPIVHLLRNAVDHGIVDKGTITLNAVREKDFALITVEDSGQGVDWEKVIDLAVEKKIIEEKDSEAYKSNIDSEKVRSLIYNPSLSTTTEVTETSGRGVGLSAVKEFMNEVGGRVFVESPISENGGTRFSLEMPMTLAIINVLLVKVHEAIYAIPFSNIERTVKVEQKNIKKMADQDIAIIDGKDIPLVELEDAFGYEKVKKAEQVVKEVVKKAEASSKKEEEPKKKKIVVEEESKTVVIVQRGKKTVGLVVNELLNEQQITIKPLPSVLHGVKGFSGSTILGDGKTVLIIDVISLFDSLNEK